MFCRNSIHLTEAPVIFEDAVAIIGLSETSLNYIEAGVGSGELVYALIEGPRGVWCCFIAEASEQASLMDYKDVLLQVGRWSNCRGVGILGLERNDFAILRNKVAVKNPHNRDLPTVFIVYHDTDGMVRDCLASQKGNLVYFCETSISGYRDSGGGFNLGKSK